MNETQGRRIAFLDGQLYVANRPETRESRKGIIPERRGG
jgi:hypothetical protein